MSNSDCQSYVSITEKDIEPALKDLLEKILLYLERFIETKEDLQQVEAELRDYENLVCLVNIIKTVFNTLANKIDLKIIKLNNQINSDTLSQRSIRTEEEYEKLEQIIQKHEAEIRTHIRIEQQLKLYAESVQSKLEDSEKTRQDLLDSTKAMINNIKRDNQRLSDNNRVLKDENEDYKSRIDSTERKFKQLDDECKLLKQKFSNQSMLVKNYERKYTLDNRHAPSFSEHKLLPYQNESMADPSTDYPPLSQNTQLSMKQNFINHTPQKQSDTSLKNGRPVHKVQNSLDSDPNRVYGLMVKSKNSSIANIKEMMNVTMKDRKTSNSGAASKNTSLNNSIVAQKQQQDAFMSQQRSRSQQGTSQAKQILKQRTEAAKVTESVSKLWRFK